MLKKKKKKISIFCKKKKMEKWNLKIRGGDVDRKIKKNGHRIIELHYIFFGFQKINFKISITNQLEGRISKGKKFSLVVILGYSSLFRHSFGAPNFRLFVVKLTRNECLSLLHPTCYCYIWFIRFNVTN